MPGGFFYRYRKVLLAALGLLVGWLLFMAGDKKPAQIAVTLTCLASLIPLLDEMVQKLQRRELGVDVLAVAAIGSALYLAQYWAAAVILLMITGGEALEDYAKARAQKELTALLHRAPQHAHVRRGRSLVDVPVGEVKVGDRILVKPGEVMPVDGVVIDGQTTLDESAITGESLPAAKKPGDKVVSGSINQLTALAVRATATSANSQYEQIVSLVAAAASTRSPIIRLADRYSLPFTLAAFGLAGLAWAMSGQALRLVEVLVVATPCPLILATPVAIVSGMSRAAARGVIIKDGAALEDLARVRAIAFDKTGTLTRGSIAVTEVRPEGIAEQELLRLAASAEQDSAHPVAQAIVAAAKQHRVSLAPVEQLQEAVGLGVSGQVDNHLLLAGARELLQRHSVRLPRALTGANSGQIAVHVAYGGRYVGVIYVRDELRRDTKRTLDVLRRLGITKLLMLTGDKQPAAAKVAAELGLTEFAASLKPADKLTAVQTLRHQIQPVAMVGDGVNDAPTLAAADVGIALGAKDSTAASQAADVVVMSSAFSRVAEAVAISRRAVAIAKQSIFVGIGLSVALMIIVLVHGIRPFIGALLQEAIDVLVILNALRVRMTH